MTHQSGIHLNSAAHLSYKVGPPQNIIALDELGWEVIVLWECETKNVEALESRVVKFIDG